MPCSQRNFVPLVLALAELRKRCFIGTNLQVLEPSLRSFFLFGNDSFGEFLYPSRTLMNGSVR